MTRYFRTVYATSLTCMLLTLITTVATGVHMPFSSFSCLLIGLLLFLLPNVVQKLEDRHTLFALLGAAAALLGFLPILLTRCPAFHYISHALSILAAALFLTTLRHGTTHNNFKARFSFILVIVLCLLVYFIVSATTVRRVSNSVQSKPILDPENLKLALNDIIPYAIVLLSSGVLCLRGLRVQHGAVDERSFRRRQLRDALIFVAAVSTVFIMAPLLKAGWELLVENVFAPLLRLFAGLVERAATGAAQPNSTIPSAAASASPPAEITSPVTPGPVAVGTEITNGTPPPAELKSSTPLLTVLTLLAFAIVIAIAWIILVKAIRRWKKYERSYPNESCEQLPETDQPKKADKPTKRSADPRKRMRYLYADFLKHLRKTATQRMRTAPDPNDPSVDPHAWGETNTNAYGWMRAGMSSLPEHSASYSYLHTRDESIANERAATFMKWFERRSKKRKTSGSVQQPYRTSTCGEIRRSAETLSRADEADLSAFTTYYEQARYRMQEAPSPEDAASMAELFGRIKPTL